MLTRAIIVAYKHTHIPVVPSLRPNPDAGLLVPARMQYPLRVVALWRLQPHQNTEDECGSTYRTKERQDYPLKGLPS